MLPPAYPPLQCPRSERAEPVRQQPDRPNDRDVVLVRDAGEQGEPDGHRTTVSGVADQPAAGLLDAPGIRPACSSRDVLVRVDRHLDVVERLGEFGRDRGWSGEVAVKDGGGRSPFSPPILWRLGAGCPRCCESSRNGSPSRGRGESGSSRCSGSAWSNRVICGPSRPGSGMTLTEGRRTRFCSSCSASCQPPARRRVTTGPSVRFDRRTRCR